MISLRLRYALYWLLTLEERTLYSVATLRGCRAIRAPLRSGGRVFLVRGMAPQTRDYLDWREFRLEQQEQPR